RVCLKAGLPATAWKDDATALFTFEGEALRCSLAALEGFRSQGRFSVPCRPEDLTTMVNLCRDNMVALLLGAVPRPFFGVPDGTVNGVVLCLQQPGTREVRYFTRLSLRPGILLQTTLFSLVQTAPQYLASVRTAPEAIDTLPMGLMFLHDPVLHGSVADPHLAGVDSHNRAFLVIERN